MDQLISHGTRRWHLDRIRFIFTEEEGGAISAIYVRREPGDDKLVWSTSTTGVAKPKLGYRRLREIEPENSNLAGEDNGRNQVDNTR